MSIATTVSRPASHKTPGDENSLFLNSFLVATGKYEEIHAASAAN